MEMGVVENMKDVSDLVKKFNDIELNRRILTLENEVLDLSRDKRRAEEKVEELERTLNSRAS
jgi:chaperonin cofactor prefoldin